jgi:hypothetical protein
MHRSTVKWLLALALIVGSTGGVSSIALASEHQHLGSFYVVSKLYYPVVPNDASIGDTGPWHASMTVQSLEAGSLQVWIMPDGRFDPDQALYEFEVLNSFGSKTLTAEEIGLPDGEVSSVVVVAMFTSVWHQRNNPAGLANQDALGLLSRPKVAGSLKMAAGQPMEDGAWTGAGQSIVDGYMAIPMDGVAWGALGAACADMQANLNDCVPAGDLGSAGGVSYLPIAQSNNDWNTLVYVSNVEGAASGASVVNVSLRPTDAAENNASWDGQMPVAPGAVWVIDVAERVGTEWIGSVEIASDAGVVAIAVRVKARTNMLLLNPSTPARESSGPGAELVAPLVYLDYFGWNTGMSVTNQAGEANNVTLRIYDAAGDLAALESRTIAPNGQWIIYLPGVVDSDDAGWIGAAMLVSNNDLPLHAAVDQVNYVNGAAMSYVLGWGGASAAQNRLTIGLPLLQKGNPLSGLGDMTGIQFFNADPQHSVEFSITLYTRAGGLIPPTMLEPISIELEPRTSATLYTVTESEIPVRSVGAVIVRITGGGGSLHAVSNTVNYAVGGDGSLAYNLVNVDGWYRPPTN